MLTKPQLKLSINDGILPININYSLEDVLLKTKQFYKLVKDQLDENILKFKTNKVDRRMLISGYNPLERKDCIYCIIQFYLYDGKLSMKVFQRKSLSNSDDRLSTEIAPMILLMYMICNLTNLQPDSYVHTFGNPNIQMDIDDSIKYPRVNITKDATDLLDFDVQHFKLSKDLFTLNTNTKYGKSYIDCYDHEEMQYLELIKDVLRDGMKFNDRTGVGTISLLGPEMKFSLENYTLPLLTTKRVFYRGIIEELLWFIRGSTDSCELTAMNVHIWDGNGSKAFLEKTGLGHRDEGDLGPVYGFQWRHFGAKYVDKYADYTRQGFDQLKHVIDTLKSGRDNGEAVIMAWNPVDLSQMALPPCHCAVQFSLDPSTNQLSCLLYQRSADLGLGVPFNIASYAIMTLMLCHLLHLEPGNFYHSLGDAHVYLNHVDPIQVQLKRKPLTFPKLKFKRPIENIEDFKYEDFEVVSYEPHSKIQLPFAL